MSGAFSRRGVLRLFGAAAVITTIRPPQPTAPAVPHAPPPAPDRAEEPACDIATQRGVIATKLETFLRSRGIKPAHVAREAGYTRQHLLRVRMGRLAASGGCAVAVTYALRRLTGEAVVLADLFPAEVVASAWEERRNLVRAYHPVEHRSVRAAFGRWS